MTDTDNLDLREKIAHIDQMLADIDRTSADHIRITTNTGQDIPPWLLVLAGVTTGAALFAAGGAFIKLIG